MNAVIGIAVCVRCIKLHMSMSILLTCTARIQCGDRVLQSCCKHTQSSADAAWFWHKWWASSVGRRRRRLCWIASSTGDRGSGCTRLADIVLYLVSWPVRPWCFLLRRFALGTAAIVVLLLLWTYDPHHSWELEAQRGAKPPRLLQHMFVCVSFAWCALHLCPVDVASAVARKRLRRVWCQTQSIALIGGSAGTR